MKNLKNLFIASALTLSSASVFANTFTDYLAALEAEAKFDASALATYQAQPDFTTTAGKLEAKVAEVQGYWAVHAETPTVITAEVPNPASTDTASYLASLAASASQVSTMRTLSTDEAAALAAAEDEIVALLTSVAK